MTKVSKNNIFIAKIDVLGINPFVFLPEDVLQAVFKQAGKSKGTIPVSGTVNGKSYRQTLLKYAGEWRFYINRDMLDNSTKRIGEEIEISIEYDPKERMIKANPKLMDALHKNQEAKQVFDSLPPSLQQEIIRYISFLKTEKSVDNNIKKAVDFLLGKGRFIGRDSLTVKSKDKNEHLKIND